MTVPGAPSDEALDLRRFPVHLGLGGGVAAQPGFTGIDWYAAYEKRTVADGAEGRLVSLHDFDADWDTWEMHPRGDELVVCLAGEITLIQELADGAHAAIALKPGEYVINPAGVWHTANVTGTATALFVTTGQETQGRPR